MKAYGSLSSRLNRLMQALAVMTLVGLVGTALVPVQAYRLSFAIVLASVLAFLHLQAGRQVSRLQKAAVRDELTGLYNYRYFQWRLAEELGRARRYGSPVSLLIIDTDNFKEFNDRYGHLTGDRVLSSLARALVETVRETDCVSRYGGDEFVVILIETAEQEARSVAERIRRQVEDTSWVDGHTGRLTVSIGVAGYNGESEREFFQKADAGLFRAKTGGGNQVG